MNSLVITKDKQAVTSSLQLAEAFRKRHSDVIRAIEDKLHSTQKCVQYQRMFLKDSYRDKSGKLNKMYYMNRDGFSFIAFGFTGEKADDFKLQYIEAFNKMEKAIQGIYHISETTLTNSVVKSIEEKLFHKIDERLEAYEDNFRPTHANKLNINNYIKNGLGNEREPEEADLVKHRVLLLLDAESWQDIPYMKLINNIQLIDESIRVVKNFRTKKQLDLFENYL